MQHSQDQQEIFKKWTNFLVFLNERRGNCQLMVNYFFDQFALNPERFYFFLQYLKKQLSQREIPIEWRKMLAQRYLDIISLLCERFGLFHEKNNLDNFCFQMVDPLHYNRINDFLMDYRNKKRKLIRKINATLENVLKGEGYRFKVKGRFKNFFSIHRNLQKTSDRDLSDMKDIFAFRIILENNSMDECFEVLNILHDRFYPIADHFKDYITIPKINGYQSIHTGLSNMIADVEFPIEVQIRTQAMDDFAEKGLAAHWIYYTQGKKIKIMSEQEKQLIHYLLHVSTASDIKNKVYFFSYKGDIFKLEKGATILDFAYSLHTSLGNKLKSAMVNGQPQPIHYPIQEGDQIELIKSAQNQAKPQWLHYVHTPYARKKIRECVEL